jgi:hypothetical protein
MDSNEPKMVFLAFFFMNASFLMVSEELPLSNKLQFKSLLFTMLQKKEKNEKIFLN